MLKISELSIILCNNSESSELLNVFSLTLENYPVISELVQSFFNKSEILFF